MKILVVGKKQMMHWPENVARFLSKEHEVKTFLYNKWTFASVFYKFFFRHKRYSKCAEKLKRLISSFEPDLILYISSFFIPKECYQILDNFPNIPRVGWAGDLFGENEKERADYLDVLFCSDTGYLKNTGHFKCESLYLPLCADETVFVNRHLPRTLPPFFAGIANPLRNRYLNAVREKCLIYGAGWPKMPQHEVHNHKLTHQEIQEFINKTQAPINLTFSKNIVNGLNFRIFEVSCCGGLILINEMPDLHLCYTIGQEAVVYHTPEELDAVIQDIVAHPKKYEKIANAGYERTLQDHTYEKRLKQMLEILKIRGIIQPKV